MVDEAAPEYLSVPGFAEGPCWDLVGDVTFEYLSVPG